MPAHRYHLKFTVSLNHERTFKTLTYTITFKRQLEFLTQPLLYFLFTFVISYSFFRWTKFSAFLPAFEFIIDFFPALILHFQYLERNVGSKLIFDRANNRMLYTQKGKSFDYSFEDIYQVTKIRSSERWFSNARHSFTNYFYYKFVFRDETELIVTCLLADDIETLLGLICSNEVETKFKLFPSV